MATHNQARRGQKTRLYTTWIAMRQRCNDPNYAAYRYYGGRGIQVCARWNDFAAFAADMGEHPGKGWTLDRRNTDGSYAPYNCRWVSRTEQSRNRNSNRLSYAAAAEIRQLHAAGVSLSELGRRYGVWPSSIYNIIKKGAWT